MQVAPKTIAEGDFSLYLQNELAKRISVNPSYSLRAFAKFLRVDPSLLSKLLSRKRPVSTKLIRQFCERLSLPPERAWQYMASVPAVREPSKKKTYGEGKYKNLTIDNFRLISDWYHYAIFELVKTKGFKSSNKWIAKRLGISEAESSIAVDRLIRLGLLKVKGNHWVRDCKGISTVSNDFTTVAFRNLQRQILQMAEKALDEVELKDRDQTSMTMAIDSTLLPEARNKIKTFRRTLCKSLQRSNNLDSVYNLGISLYPITRKETP